MIIFQNTVMGLTGLFAVMIPDVPSSVKTQIKRENLLAREALFENDSVDKVMPTKSDEERQSLSFSDEASELKARNVISTEETLEDM